MTDQDRAHRDDYELLRPGEHDDAERDAPAAQSVASNTAVAQAAARARGDVEEPEIEVRQAARVYTEAPPEHGGGGGGGASGSPTAAADPIDEAVLARAWAALRRGPPAPHATAGADDDAWAAPPGFGGFGAAGFTDAGDATADSDWVAPELGAGGAWLPTDDEPSWAAL